MGRALWVEAELVLATYVRTYLPSHARKQPTHVCMLVNVFSSACIHVHGTYNASLFD